MAKKTLADNTDVVEQVGDLALDPRDAPGRERIRERTCAHEQLADALALCATEELDEARQRGTVAAGAVLPSPKVRLPLLVTKKRV